jgi:hypothetical protein
MRKDPRVTRKPETAWIEVNITPPGDDEALLLDVVGPLIRETAPAVWFFFWEDREGGEPGEEDLRLRIRDPDRPMVTKLLDAAKDDGRIAGWYEGNHGRAGEAYSGETGFYGPEAWELICRDWTAMSNLSLALIELEARDGLTRSRSFHLRRAMHLRANQLGLDDISTCLFQALRYLELEHRADPDANHLLAAIDRYLYGRKAREPGAW